MADGTCGIGQTSRAYSSVGESACVDSEAKRRIEARQAEEGRKRADAEAEARASAHYANGRSCELTASGAAPACGREVATSTTKPPAQVDPAEKARIDAIVRPGVRFTTRAAVEGEVVRLRSVDAGKGDTALERAVQARVNELRDRWCELSRAAGMGPPSASFNPYLASDEELKSALLWTTLGGTVPIEAAMHDGGVRFREDIIEAVALRTPGLGEELIASYASEPGTQRQLLERELRRLGDRQQCRADDTNATLIARRADLLRKRDVEEIERGQNELQIGLDGRQGTARWLVEYELEQRVIAMNPGTTTGSIAAAVAATRGGTTEEIRAAGQAGNAAEGVAQGLAGVDPRKLDKRVPPGMVGRRRRPTGPGFGRRTRTFQAGGTADARRRTPVAFDDKHVLNGEVKRTAGGALRAVGFHHQAPGTEQNARIVSGTQTKPDRFGVYEASVEVRDTETGQWVRKNRASTFFPQQWSRSEVRSAVLEAYANRVDRGGGEWEGRLSSGMRIIITTDTSGRITSAYPLRESD